MATYAQPDDLRLYAMDNAEVAVPDDDASVERLLERAERRVDLALGPYPDSSPGGLKLDPATLTAEQQGALARATCAAAEWELLVGLDVAAGGIDFTTGDLQVLQRPQRTSPRMLEELAGSGLVRRSGSAAPDA